MRGCLSSTSASGAAPCPLSRWKAQRVCLTSPTRNAFPLHAIQSKTRASWALMTNHAHLLPCRLRCSWQIHAPAINEVCRLDTTCDDASNREPPLREL
jgi:hypothetical protein